MSSTKAKLKPNQKHSSNHPKLTPNALIDTKYTELDDAKFILEPNKKQSANHPKLPQNTPIDAKYTRKCPNKLLLILGQIKMDGATSLSIYLLPIFI